MAIKESALFVLLTDFGLQDPYVGQVKAVLLQDLPGAVILDLTHGVQAHNVLEGSFFLASSWDYLPEQSVVLGIVDPGVGSKRDIILLQAGQRLVLAPDNGLLTLLLNKLPQARCWRWRSESVFLLSATAHVPVKHSQTFHGRDIFAPLAVRLVCHNGPEQMLWQVVDKQDLALLQIWGPRWKRGHLLTSVLHVDHFGNVVLNLSGSEFWPLLQDRVLQGKKILFGLGTDTGQNDGFDPGVSWQQDYGQLRGEERCFAVRPVNSYAALEPGELGLLWGSQGYLELAMNQDSCARCLGTISGAACFFLFV